jgi:tetratricopeptide (TPR) repeat protein
VKSAFRVFLSHTSELRELPAERSFVSAAEAAVIRAGHAVSDMAYFAARDSAPAESCFEQVAGSNVYVGIIGRRYGASVPGRSDFSYTELEFETATMLGLPRLLFLVPDDVLARPAAAEPPDRVARQEAFRRRLLDEAGVTAAWVRSPAELELALLHALVELDARPEATAAAMRTLPRDLASFTGREEELRRLLGAVSPTARSGRVVVISAIDGMAGVGKSAFAVHAAHRLAPDFPDGQLFLDLHAHTAGQRPVEPADALGSLLLTMGAAPERIPQSLDGRAATWRDQLNGKRMLIVLDDAVDHEQVRPLLPGGPGSLVLITSRRRLAALEDALPLTLDTLPPVQAVRLFERLTAGPDAIADTAAIAELVGLCGHLPLAIALLAGRLRSRPAWTVRHLVEKLEDAQDRVAEMHAESIAVDAAFELSYRNLSPGQQRLFRRLGLHPGRDVDARAAAALDGIDLAQAERRLEALYNDHLIHERLPGRYHLHDLIRDFARGLAAQDGAAGNRVALDRLFGYYLHTASLADRQIASRTDATTPPMAIVQAAAPDLSSQRSALSWLETERANLVACLDHAAALADPTLAISLAHAMHSFLRHNGHWTQALAMHQTALAAARRLDDRYGQAGALHQLGVTQYLTEDYAAAIASYDEASALLRDLGDRRGLANVLSDRSIVLQLSCDYLAATTSLHEALTLFRELDDRPGQANVLTELGIVEYCGNQFANAMASFERALALYARLAHKLGQANVLTNMGIVQRLTGDYPVAAVALTAALDLYGELDDRFGQAAALTELGRLQMLTDDAPAAISSLSRAVAFFRELGSRRGQANALAGLGGAQCHAGDYRSADASLRTALAVYVELGSSMGEAMALARLGNVQFLTGEPATGRASLVAALAIFRDLGDQLAEATALNVLGARLIETSSTDDAIGRHREALRLARDSHSPLEEARALEGVGRCRIRDGEVEEGRALLRQALAVYRRIGAPEAGRVTVTLAEPVATTGTQSPG